MTRNFARPVPGRDDELLVESFLSLHRDLSNRAAAAELGVSEATIRRWRRGKIATPSRTETRLRLRSCIGHPAVRWSGALRPPEAEEAGVKQVGTRGADAGHATVRGGDAETALELFGSVDRIVRYIGSIGLPGQEKARKRYVLEGVRHVITAVAPLPPWWYDLVERVESHEL